MTARHLPPATLAVAALVAPWAAFSLLLPMPHRALALLLLALLAALLAASATWSRHRAAQTGRDGDEWALAAVLTLGLSMAPLAVRPTPSASALQFLCHDCGRLGDWREPFCFACGSV